MAELTLMDLGVLEYTTYLPKLPFFMDLGVLKYTPYTY